LQTGSDISGEGGFTGMLMFAMPRYEVKFQEDGEWLEISELELMDELYKTSDKVTPAIKKMIMGKRVKTPHGIFRLKLKGGEYGQEPSELSAA
jgi:hypothetical protein